MAEPSPVEMERLEQVCRIVDAIYDALVKQVIAGIKALPAHCRQSGDDSKLKDVWEEFKYQVQGEESIAFEFYQQTIEQICAGVVAGLDPDRRRLLWLWSEAYYDWDNDNGEFPAPNILAEAVARELYDRVCGVASDEELVVDPDEGRRNDETL